MRRLLAIWAATVFVLLWVGFVYAFLTDSGQLDDLWTWLRDRPPLPQAILWVLFLPIAVGLWFWQGSTPVRVIGFIVIVFWTLSARSSYRALSRS